MVAGIGTDITEVERVERAISRYGDRFLERIFTVKERSYCLEHKNSIQHFAGRFAAKEAISKALGFGIGESIAWHDIEIINDKRGKPLVVLSSRALDHVGDANVQVSISHCRDYAVAFALIT